MEAKQVASSDLAFDVFTKQEGKPYAHLQWKASEVFMDFHCKCGSQFCVEGSFVYHIQCPGCKTVYATNPFIELVEVQNPETASSIVEAFDPLN